ncbi:uncharacterized protein LOC6574026 isoform X2 [Drosophila mojavensis]|uniref:Tudor domain-containing protein 1 n=2 Tax=Drosophila mojavensis TaxID=7230 RepID=B4K9B3_DROMO|nr:uncharacterized protein LOC6574026 isoform X2 [Drosophila mojavensis]XP_032587276.1 uncharacterized protein LOC6574026 isoform X2 [Drosophila mojavensis]XP_032587277.1 uncharacterized protein LOC6574026 isoform X2 [Drosophila mojavensis]XP_043864229.1 uncharacterized protein LOC6574026 isoform X2 [Drosophila mojavensis]EDW15545.2 uncharacterized protein Dmoj_GI22729 [Drosophila mojavensis]
MDVDINKLLCTICGISANLMCQRCGEPYCNDVCQRKDWQRHKYICTLMPALVSIRPIKPMATVAHDMAAAHNVIIPKEYPNEQLASMVRKLSFGESSGSQWSQEWRNSMMPSTNDFFECRVTCMETEGPIWVMDVANIESLERLTNNIARSMQQQKSFSIHDLSAGILVGAAVDHKMYRAEVLKVNVSAEYADVRLIDYGTVVSCMSQNIYRAVQRMSQYKAHSFRVKLPNNKGVQINKNLTLRLLGRKTVDGIEQAELKQKLMVPLCLPFELMAVEPAVKVVKILHRNVLLEEPQVALLQLKAMSNINDELNASLKNLPGELFTEVPSQNNASTIHMAARTNQGYRRALLIDYIEEPRLFLVYEMDEGCISLTSEVCHIPSKLVGLPLRVFSVTLEDNQAGTLENHLKQCGPDLSIKFNNDSLMGKEKDKLRTAKAALYSKNKQVCAVRARSFLGVINLIGLKYWRQPIENDDLVYISHVVNYKEVCISSVHCKQYGNIFNGVETKCLPVDDFKEIRIGDIVLVVCSSRCNYRAEIVSLDSNKFGVRNIDTGSMHLVVGANLRRPCRFVENLPVSHCRVKIKTICNIPPEAVPPNSVALQILKRLYENNMEMLVKFDISDRNTVDLLDLTAEPHSLMTRMLPVLFTPTAVELTPAETLPSLSTMEQDLMKSSATLNEDFPEVSAIERELLKSSVTQNVEEASLPPLPLSPPTSPPTNKSENSEKSSKHVQRYYYNDLERRLLPLGENMEVIILNAVGLENLGYVTACFFDSEEEAERLQNFLNLVAQLGSDDDKLQPGFLPEVGELCLTLYSEDNSWYRGICQRITGKKASILYCDFGNVELVPVEQIKPISSELLHCVYATKCFIDGFDKDKPFVHLEKYLADANKIVCDVLEGPEPNSRTLKIPILNEILSKELI